MSFFPKRPSVASGVLVAAALALLVCVPVRAADTTVHVIVPETRYTPWLGMTLQELDGYVSPGSTGARVRGLVVVDVTKGGPADSAGLAKGDTIISLDGRLVEAYDDFSGWLKDFDIGSTIKLLVDKGGEEKDVFLTLGSFPPALGYGFLDPWLKDYLAEAGESGGCSWLRGYHEYDMLFYSSFASLELSEDQKKAARAVMSGFEKEMIRLSAEVRVGEIELRELLAEPDTDLKRVRSKINEVSSYGAEAEYLRVKTREELKKILGPEDRARLDDEMSVFDARGWMWGRRGADPLVPLPND